MKHLQGAQRIPSSAQILVTFHILPKLRRQSLATYFQVYMVSRITSPESLKCQNCPLRLAWTRLRHAKRMRAKSSEVCCGSRKAVALVQLAWRTRSQQCFTSPITISPNKPALEKSAFFASKLPLQKWSPSKCLLVSHEVNAATSPHPRSLLVHWSHSLAV